METPNQDPKHELQSYALLMNPELEQNAARLICKAAKSKIHSKTRLSIGSLFGYFLDGPLGAQGQIKSSLYYAFSNSGGILVAKVYTDIAGTNDSQISFKREVGFNKAISHDHVARFVASFSFETRHVIIMPLFARSAADLLTQHATLPTDTVLTIASNIGSALDYIHSCGYCFADVKPSNIMMESSLVGNAKLIDFGSAIKLGETVIEISKPYCLDVNVEIGSRVLDFTCLGSSLAQLSGIDISCYSLASELLLLIQATPKLEFDLAGACLSNGSFEKIRKVINKYS